MNASELQLIVRLAMMMCASDGEVHEDEDSLLQEWMESIRVSPTVAREAKEAALKAIRGTGLNIKKTCEQLDEAVTVSLKYDVLELCLRIAQIDGVGTDDEMRFLMSVGKWLDLDYGKFREMRDKILPVSIHETNDIEALLGLHENMTPSEVRKHLLKEYQRWNQLIIHQDSKKRKQAKEMLEIIAKKRSEVRNG